MKKFRFIAFLLALCFLAACQHQVEGPRAKYVFLFIGDGMGISHVIASEAFQAGVSGKKYTPLNFRRFPATGISTTYAANRFMTGSAAAATALATGHKTSIGRIAMDSLGEVPFESIAYKAKKKGMRVGIITSVSIDHATPAAFYANQPNRNMSFEIGIDLFESNFDFFGGGGFIKPDGVVGGDSVNLYALAADNGYNYINTPEGFEAISTDDEKVLFVNPTLTNGASMYNAIDQPEDYITLADITEKAIRCLDNDKGFFIMVEGGKIDWTSHANDLASVVHEVIDFSDAVSKAIAFYEQHPDETLIVVTADHDTGGLGLGNQTMGSENNFAILANQKLSGEAFNKVLQLWRAENEPNEESFDSMLALLKEHFGIGDQGAPISLDETEMEAYKKIFMDYDNNLLGEDGNYSRLTLKSTALLTLRAGAGWTSMNHTAVAVPVYSQGVNHAAFSGNLDNTDIPNIIWESMK